MRQRPQAPKSGTWELQSLQPSYFTRPLSTMRILTTDAERRSPSPVVGENFILSMLTEDARKLEMKPIF